MNPEIQNKRQSICLLGASLPSGNMGVQALAASLITILERVCPGIEITILCGGSSGIRTENVYVGQEWKTVTVCNFRMSPRAKWSEHLLITFIGAILYRILPVAAIRRRLLTTLPILDLMLRSTFVGDIRGGDSFSDIYGVNRFIIGSLPSLLALLLRKNLVLLPQTYGPFRSNLAQFLARQIVRRSKLVMARDKESLAFADRLLAGLTPCRSSVLCPDVAFSLESLMPDDPAIEPSLPNDTDYELIGFNVSGLLYYGGYNQNNMFGLHDDYQETVFHVLQFLLTLPNSRVLLLPHMVNLADWTVENDIHASRHLRERFSSELQSRIHLAAGNYDQHQVKALIGRCDFFVGSRMHSCIAALSQGVPTVGIAYSRKFKGVFETVELGEAALDATRLARDEIVSKVAELHALADDNLAVLQNRLSEVTTHTAQCFTNCFLTYQMVKN